MSSTSVSNLIRKAKMKEVDLLKKSLSEEGSAHAISQFIENGSRPFGIGDPIDFRSSIRSRFQTVSVMPEYNKKAKTGFILGMHPPEIMGGVLRDAGAKAIVVSMDKKSSGTSIDEFTRFCREQTSARRFSPGPIPIIWNEYIVDKVQIQFAAALGASAVMLYPEVVDGGNLADMVSTCAQLGVEAIVLAKTLSEAEEAVAAGAKTLCFHSLDEEGFVELHQQLKDKLKHVDNSANAIAAEDILFIAKLRAEVDFSIYAEIDTAWTLRDHGFHCVWPSPEAVFGTGMRDIYGNVLALRAKASRQFFSPRQFLMDRNKEGAQEYLGDIMM